MGADASGISAEDSDSLTPSDLHGFQNKETYRSILSYRHRVMVYDAVLKQAL